MKKSNAFKVALIALAMGVVGLSGCKNTPTPAPDPTPDPEPGWKKADKAMTTFGERLALGNYRMVSEGLIDVSLVGTDEVVIRYPFEHVDKDWAVMSVNGEAFQAALPKNKDMQNLVFLDKESALKAYEAYLPNAFFSKELTHKTIWELLYNPNSYENPYHFVARNNTAYPLTIIGNMVNFGTEQAAQITDIALDLDGVDANVATFSFKYMVMSNPPHQVEAKITVTFDTYESDSRVDAWMSNPDRTYPAAVGTLNNWTSTKFWLDLQSSLKIHENIDGFVPFINEASYAVVDNAATFLYSDKMVDKIRDYHGTEEHVENYKMKLIRNQYNAIKLDDGTTHYRRILRAYPVTGKRVFADIQVAFDDGFYMEVTLFYEADSYNSLDALNEAIYEKGFVKLPEDTNNVFSNWDGLDYTFHAYESHTCLQDYTLYIIIYADFTNINDAEAYLDAYTDDLVNNYGYTYSKADNQWILQTHEHEWKFRISFTSDGKVKMDINVQDFVLGSVIAEAIKEAGFPEFDDEAIYVNTGRDIRDYAKYQNGQDCDLAYETIFSFDTIQHANQFGHDYKAALEDLGFTSKGEKDGYKVYSKGNMTVRVAIGGPTSNFIGLDFYVYSQK